MSAAHRHDNMVPPAALKLAFGMVGASLLLTIAVRAEWIAPSPSAAQLRTAAKIAPVTQRDLIFADVDGFVRITDARTGAPIAMIGQENSGFIRGVMRGLARERRMHGMDGSKPFRLTLFADSELALTDTATGRVVELTGFGTTNRDAFLALLERR